jgi:hypothetical protein
MGLARMGGRGILSLLVFLRGGRIPKGGKGEGWDRGISFLALFRFPWFSGGSGCGCGQMPPGLSLIFLFWYITFPMSLLSLSGIARR